MTHRTPFVPLGERAHGVGATGGLPGANADPRTEEVTPEDIESTVAAGDTADGDLTDLSDGKVEPRPVLDNESVDLNRGRD